MATFEISGLGQYGLSEKIKGELNALTVQVLDARYEVEQFQAITDALSAKAQTYQLILSVAYKSRQMALSNKNLMSAIVESASNLKDNSKIALDTMESADKQNSIVAVEIKNVMNKLIYAAQLINKLSNLVIRKKALNPLISDELIALLGTAGKDANNAVALTLVALKSAFVSMASSVEARAANALANNQAIEFYELLTGKRANGKPSSRQAVSLTSLIESAYKNSVQTYAQAEDANNMVTKQLNKATADLGKAQVKLTSLQAGLAAAKAAVLAS